MNNKNNYIVRIRPLKLQDAYTSCKWRNDPEIWRNTLHRPDKVISVEDEITWIKKVTREENSYRFAILADDVYIGNVQLIEITESTCFYGIFIGNKNFWKKGIAKVATRLILSFAFDNLKIDEVRLGVRFENHIAQSLYKKLGFEEISYDHQLIFMSINKERFLENV